MVRSRWTSNIAARWLAVRHQWSFAVFLSAIPHELQMGELCPQGSFCVCTSQWETTLECNVVPHRLGAYTKWSLFPCLKGFETTLALGSKWLLWLVRDCAWEHGTRLSTIESIFTCGNVISGLIFCCQCFLAATKQLYQWYFLSVCPSVWPSVTPFWLCTHHRIIMKFSGVITLDQGKVHAKGQGQRSKVKVTEVTTQLFVSGL